MTLAFILLATSAILGLATGLVFRVETMALISLLIAIASATSLRAHGFGFAAGVSVSIGCLVISQIAYVAFSLMMSRSDHAEDSTQEEADGDPNSRGEQNVSNDDK
jgi:uncharacterized membrane protein YkgB